MNALIGVARAAPAAASARALAAGPICRIDIVRDLSQAATIWDSLDACGALRTPYQRYDWVCLWQRHVGAHNAVEPLLVVGRGVDGAPLFLWPLGIQAVGPFSVARFLGGKHTNFNLGLWRRDLAASITAAELRGVLERIRLSSSVVPKASALT